MEWDLHTFSFCVFTQTQHTHNKASCWHHRASLRCSWWPFQVYSGLSNPSSGASYWRGFIGLQSSPPALHQGQLKATFEVASPPPDPPLPTYTCGCNTTWVNLHHLWAFVQGSFLLGDTGGWMDESQLARQSQKSADRQMDQHPRDGNTHTHTPRIAFKTFPSLEINPQAWIFFDNCYSHLINYILGKSSIKKRLESSRGTGGEDIRGFFSPSSLAKQDSMDQ